MTRATTDHHYTFLYTLNVDKLLFIHRLS